jgi:hypothetical protein
LPKKPAPKIFLKSEKNVYPQKINHFGKKKITPCRNCFNENPNWDRAKIP